DEAACSVVHQINGICTCGNSTTAFELSDLPQNPLGQVDFEDGSQRRGRRKRVRDSPKIAVLIPHQLEWLSRVVVASMSQRFEHIRSRIKFENGAILPTTKLRHAPQMSCAIANQIHGLTSLIGSPLIRELHDGGVGAR